MDNSRKLALKIIELIEEEEPTRVDTVADLCSCYCMFGAVMFQQKNIDEVSKILKGAVDAHMKEVRGVMAKMGVSIQ